MFNMVNEDRIGRKPGWTTVLLFTEGKAFTNLEFDSPPNDPVPPQFVTDVGQKQDAAIKNGLHG
jgi:hypothetical protein